MHLPNFVNLTGPRCLCQIFASPVPDASVKFSQRPAALWSLLRPAALWSLLRDLCWNHRFRPSLASPPSEVLVAVPLFPLGKFKLGGIMQELWTWDPELCRNYAGIMGLHERYKERIRIKDWPARVTSDPELWRNYAGIMHPKT